MKRAKAPDDTDMTASQFIALPDEEKEKIFQELERETPEQREARSTPLSLKDRKRWKKFQERQRQGRPTVGKGAVVVAVSIERGLLARANAYAKRHNMKRTQLIAKGLRKVMDEPDAG